MATPDTRLEEVTKIELESVGEGMWDVVLIRTRGIVLSGTTRYSADSVDQAISIAKSWMENSHG